MHGEGCGPLAAASSGRSAPLARLCLPARNLGFRVVASLLEL